MFGAPDDLEHWGRVSIIRVLHGHESWNQPTEAGNIKDVQRG